MAQFRILCTQTAPYFYVRCSNCKHEFWTDAVTEENLIIVQKDGREQLIEKCPNCKEIRDWGIKTVNI